MAHVTTAPSLTVLEVTLRLGVSNEVVRAWCREGRLHWKVGNETFEAYKLAYGQGGSRRGEYRIPEVIVEAIERGDLEPMAKSTGDAA
jgi:hypothetical protein